MPAFPALDHISRALLALSAACALMLAVAVRPAAAQSSPASAAAPSGSSEPVEPPGYRASVDAAIHEYEAGNFAESRALFERAHTAFPNARTLRGLGMTEFELRNYPASIFYLEQALGANVRPLQNELRAETEQLLGRARGFVGRLTLELSPPNASVVMNGTTVQLGPDRTLNLVVGDYTLELSAPEHDSERRAVRIAGGEVQTLSVSLAKPIAVPAPQAATAAAPPPAERASVLESPWLWTAVGVAVAGTAVGIGLALSGGDVTNVAAPPGSSGVLVDGPAL